MTDLTERLGAARRLAGKWEESWFNSEVADTIRALADEVERLREALERVYDECAGKPHDIAREALRGALTQENPE